MCSRFLEVACVLPLLLLAGCREERRVTRGVPPGGAALRGVQQSELQPGAAEYVVPARNPVGGNAHAIAEGRILYNQFNCSGCHANGGGAIGPPLMDDEWIYGSEPRNIFSVIVEGRPQGMPAFGGRIPEHQVWQLVAYVRSLSDLNEQPGPRTMGGQMRQQSQADRE
jgi:cytochrome c oxidase cbb3-type subunit III